MFGDIGRELKGNIMKNIIMKDCLNDLKKI